MSEWERQVLEERAKANARIAELRGLLAYATDTDAYRRIRARAEQAEAELATACAQRDAAIAASDGFAIELTKAKASITELEAAGNRLGDVAVDVVLTSIEAVTELAEAKARITEFEARLQRQYAVLLEHKSRAEKAEAELDISREAHRMVQSALLSQAAETERVEAERDALRAALEKIREKYDHWSLAGGVARAALAALAPSPVGREG